MTLLAPLVGAIVSWLVTGWITETAHTRRWVDAAADGRRMHVTPVPRLGGVAVCLGALAALATAVASGVVEMAEVARHGRLVAGAGAGCLVLLGVGVRDDLVGVRPRTKLAAQALAGAAVCAGGVRVGSIALGEWSWHPGWLAPVLVVVWVVAVTNAVNLIDGLDGLASGLGMIGLGATSLAATLLGHGWVAAVALAVAGAVAGFAHYNRHPARIFLGDSGSLTIGYFLAVLSIVGGTTGDGRLLAILPAGVLAIPLLDTALAVVRRWLRGARVFGGDARHVHHRLLAIGFTHRQAVRVLHTAAALVAALALALAFAAPVFPLGAGAAALCALLLAYGVYRLEYSEFAEAFRAGPRLVLTGRAALRDRIHARELAATLAGARSLAEVDELLAAHAASFRFVDLRLRAREAPPEPGHPAACTLDFPVDAAGDAVLRIRYVHDAARPGAAERVARTLAPVLDARLRALRSAGPEPRRVQLPAIQRAHALS